MAGQRKASFSAAALSARLQAPRCGSAAGGESGGGGPLPWYSERVGWGFLPILSVSIWPENGKGRGPLRDGARWILDPF